MRSRGSLLPPPDFAVHYVHAQKLSRGCFVIAIFQGADESHVEARQPRLDCSAHVCDELRFCVRG